MLLPDTWIREFTKFDKYRRDSKPKIGANQRPDGQDGFDNKFLKETAKRHVTLPQTIWPTINTN